MCLCIHARMQSIRVNSFILLIQKFVRCYVGGNVRGGNILGGNVRGEMSGEMSGGKCPRPGSYAPDQSASNAFPCLYVGIWLCVCELVSANHSASLKHCR